MADLTGMMQAAAGAGGENLYIEDVFFTYTYTGNSSTQTITNGIDLAGEGGLVWIKGRSTAGYDHRLFDTERGATETLVSNTTAAEATDADTLTAFNADGFTLGSDQYVNNGTITYVSWTFRKAPKFFDVVTYTGTGANRTVAHNLGSVPGCIIVKRTDTTGAWQVYHRANTANPETDYLVLNTTAATADSDTRWNDTLPTDAVFTVGTEATVNASGGTYVAYLFAHDAGGFGDDGEQNVISCGSYTGTGTDNNATTLGWEPQWVLIKKSSSTGGWMMADSIRGIATDGVDPYLQANEIDAEVTGTDWIDLSATGFSVQGAGNYWNVSGQTYIYIAIRRGPMKVPEAGTQVFMPITKTADAPTTNYSEIGFFFDAVFNSAVDGTFGGSASYVNRLSSSLTRIGTGNSQALVTSSNAAEASYSYTRWDGETFSVTTGWSSTKFAWYFFKRAPGFFDVVCYTGTGSATTITHNLGVVPELIIVKNRNQADAWQVYAGDATDYLVLNTTAATADNVDRWNDTAPTASVFTIGTAVEVNTNTEKYVAYLFASLAGVSKVGTYTGNGTSVTVTTGFQPRFILVKRTDSTGNWIVGDSARGLVAGDDPFLLLNSTAAETTNEDWVDVSATGFTINETAANANVNTGTYLYFAIS